MPTSYTAKIENGDIKSPKEFVKLCLREFNIMYRYREEPLSKEIVLNFDEIIENETFYYKQHLEECKKELEEIKSKNNEELKEKWISEINERIKSKENVIKICNEKSAKYDKFIDAINKWECSKGINNIKKFAISQCEVSKYGKEPFLCEIDFLNEKIRKLNSDFKACYKAEVSFIKGNIKYYEKCIKDTTKRINKERDFYDKFMKEIESLPDNI